MLFEKKMDPRCSYCSRSARLDDETVMCIKMGVVPAPDFSRLKDEDFSL